MSVPSIQPEDSPSSPVICPTFEDINSAQETLSKEKELLSIQLQSMESSLDESRFVQLYPFSSGNPSDTQHFIMAFEIGSHKFLFHVWSNFN